VARILLIVPTIAVAIMTETAKVGVTRIGQIAPMIALILTVTIMVYVNQTIAKIPITVSMTVMKIKIIAIIMAYVRMI
jgi:hypothetical protein